MMTKSFARFTSALAVVLGTGIAVVLSSGYLEAASQTANLAVSSSVSNNCTITSAAVAFGSYDPVVANASTVLNGSGTVTVACTKGTSASIGLNLGSNASGSTRRMTDGSSNYLQYEIYQEGTYSNVWGSSGAGLLIPAAAPSKAARNFTAYGQIFSNQDVPAGSYTDTVVATVNF